MLDLSPQPPAGGQSYSAGGMTLSEVDPGPMTLLMPFTGKENLLSKAMETAHGLAFPEPNCLIESGATRALWFGADAALLMGAVADSRLLAHAAITDQSDAWTCLSLKGAGGEDALARLIPLDLRAAHFPEGRSARTQIGHMSGAVARIGVQCFFLMVFRSMADTLFHEVKEAMDMVAARAEL